MRRMGQAARAGLFSLFILVVGVILPVSLAAAPYAALVMDARTGEVIHSRNADTQLHPASLTKMMTLYVAFVAIQRGEISLDTEIRVTAAAAGEPPSRLGLQTGQTIRLRYLLRAAAVKSANDAATAIGIAISGSQEAFAARMNATAQAMGMTNTHFINMHGLTREGHMSTARDMSVLGRHLVYDFPQYYNLFSRRTADAGIAQVNNTNTRFLDAYRGADGIKTGYTVAAGYNLVASAERDGVRIIATVFGGTSTANRNARVTELLDMGFAAAPANATVRAPEMGQQPGNVPSAPGQINPGALIASSSGTASVSAARTIRVTGQVNAAPRPPSRPGAGAIDPTAAAINAAVGLAVEEAVDAALAEALGLDLGQLDDDLSSLDPATAVPSSLSDMTNIETVAAYAMDAITPGTDMPFGTDLPFGTTSEVTPEDFASSEPAISPAIPSALAMAPPSRPTEIIMTAEAIAIADDGAPGTEMVSRMSASDGQHWGINVGTFNSRGEADRVLIQVAVAEAGVLQGGVRRIIQGSTGWNANIVGLNRDTADLACRRLAARGMTCLTMGTEG